MFKCVTVICACVGFQVVISKFIVPNATNIQSVERMVTLVTYMKSVSISEGGAGSAQLECRVARLEVPASTNKASTGRDLEPFF